MLYSFDVFDTLITRRTKTPKGVFILMREKLFQDDAYSHIPYSVKNEFVDLRIKAESNCRAYSEKAEITLGEIYHMLTKISECSDEQSCLIMDLEILYEKNLSIGIGKNIHRIPELINNGHKVVLISDMYLDKETVWDMLRKAGFPVERLHLYLSSEYGMTKASGLLYSKVKETEYIEYSQWEHIGDNVISDNAVPHMLGIRTNPYIITRYNSSMDTPGGEIVDGIRQYVENDLDLSAEEMIGIYYSGPILYAYVKWILEMCQKKNITELLFLARDGYILKRIAAIICERMNLPIKLKYIYSSRTAWRTDDPDEIVKVKNYISQCIESPESSLAFVDTQGTGVSVDRICRTCGISARGFYFCMLGTPSDEVCEKYVYWDRNKHSKIIELLCRAPHGATLGYTLKNNVWEPVLADNGMNNDQISKFEKYLNGIEIFSREMVEIETRLGLTIPLRDMVRYLLNQIDSAKESYVWDFFGELNHDDNNTEQVFAPNYTVSELLKCIRGDREYLGGKLDYSIRRLGKDEREDLKREEKDYINAGMVSTDERPTGSLRKVVVYGAGARGRSFICELLREPDICIIGWTDRDYRKYHDDGWKVMPFEETKELPYDDYVIAIANRQSEIRTFLIECGIDQNKIKTTEEMI